VISSARKINLVVFIERADGDAGRRANDLRNANGGLDDGFDGGANDGHFYYYWNCLYILLPENVYGEVVRTVFIAPPVPLYLRCSIEVILSALLVLMAGKIIISLLPEIDDFSLWCYNRKLLTFRRAEINLRIIAPLVFQEVSIYLTNVAHLILIMCIYL